MRVDIFPGLYDYVPRNAAITQKGAQRDCFCYDSGSLMDDAFEKYH